MIYQLDPNDAVTVVVDMQRLFTEPGSPYGNDAEQVIASVNLLTAASREQSIPVVFSRLEFPNGAADAGLISDWPQVRDGFFSAASEWTDLDPRLARAESDHGHNRSRPGAFSGGALAELMKQLGKHQIILSGLSLNNAVSFTAHEAFSRDIPTFVVSDAVGLAPFEDSATLQAHLDSIGTWASEVVTVEDIVNRTRATQSV